MIRSAVPLLCCMLSLSGCGAPTAPVAAPLAAPSPAAGSQPIVLRRCDDGGDGGVLIDGICL